MSNKIIDHFLERLPIVPCQEATRLTSLSMERRLSLKETFDLRLHMMVCDLCVRFSKQVHGLRQVTRHYQLPGEYHLPTAAKDQLKQTIRNFKN